MCTVYSRNKSNGRKSNKEIKLNKPFFSKFFDFETNITKELVQKVANAVFVVSEIIMI